MTPQTATRTRPGAARRRTTPRRGGKPRPVARARRRRRGLAWIVALGLLAVVVVLALPAAKRAVVTEFGLPLRYAGTIRTQAAQKHVPAPLIAAVIYAETKFEPRTSPTGAEGLMQVEPQTALDLARLSGATAFTVSDLQHPATNIAYGTYYLRALLDRYAGSQVLALAAYNGGSTNVDRWQAQARADGHSLAISEIPFPQTRAYVAKVLGAERRYARKYPRQLGLR